MKKLLAFLLCFTAVSCAWAEKRIFVEYPTLGECTGDSVRIRSGTNTNSEVLGRLNEFDKIIVLDKVKSGKDIWYEVDNPVGDQRAYVFGKYILPAYRQEFQKSQAAKILTDIRLTYGSNPEKMSILSGKPKKLTHRKNETGFPVTIADFGDYRAFYFDSSDEISGYLKSLEVKSGKKPFGDIYIGDSVNKLRKELGDPENESENLWEYDFLLYGYDEGADELVDSCIFKFSIKDGKISRMYYYKHDNGEEEEEKW